ncbi:MAG TPA: single-stranded-DNA-specific exonuclease RecJ, partial [Clostridia bacterium]|nr:single-stranded-DNA-specific exonuclease RecJ [Clostridia bacterium]
MRFSSKKWSLSVPDWSLQYDLISELPISSTTAQMLINRGISSVSEARLFLHNSLTDLSSPWIIPGVNEAVHRLDHALAKGEKIMVYGDYDVDGLTSTAIMVSLLRQLGAEVSHYIPDRSEGYGLHLSALEQASTQGFSLIITVDCGITAAKEVAWGKDNGLDFIITDHHEPGTDIPEEVILVNPKLMPGNGQLGHLAGVGVAFKLAQALEEEFGLPPAGEIFGGGYLDLVALGTIADVVPLTGENRILATYGLKLLSQTRRAGLRALLQATGLEGKDITPYQIAFILAPRLNAAGRVDSALPALELLLTDSEQEGRELALLLNAHNESRQILEQQFLKDAISLLEKEHDPDQEKIIVLSSPLWHAGILGIVASKMVDIYGKPVILLAIEGDQARGSGRSIPGFNLYHALESCQEMLVKSGGHEQAIGLTLETSQISQFKNRLNEYALPRLTEENLQPVLKVDAEVLPGQLDENLMRELEQLQPFGYGNPEPVLVCRQAGLLDCRGVGREGKHLKLKVSAGISHLEAIAFNFGHLAETAATLEETTDLAFSIERNY